MNFWELLQPGVEQYIPPQYTTVNIPSPPPNPPQPGSPEWAAQQQTALAQIPPQAVQTPAALPPLAPIQQPQAMQVPQQPQIAQPAPIQQPQTPAPEKVSAWKGFLDSMKDPSVIGPMQTFLSAIAVPLRPGENLGARIGYASTLMNLHRQMLQENAVNLPLAQREKEAKVRQAEASVASTEASTQETEGRVKFNEATFNTRKKKLETEYQTAIKEQNIKAAEAAMKEIELLYKENGIRLDQGYREALIDKAWRDANAPYDVDSDTQTDKRKVKLANARGDMDFVFNMFDQATQNLHSSSPAERAEQFRAWLSQQAETTQQRYARGYQAFKEEGEPLPVYAGRGKAGAGKSGDRFEVGKIYKDAKGNRAKYLGNGKWEQQ